MKPLLKHVNLHSFGLRHNQLLIIAMGHCQFLNQVELCGHSAISLLTWFAISNQLALYLNQAHSIQWHISSVLSALQSQSPRSVGWMLIIHEV
jgi:hypothetical protein